MNFNRSNSAVNSDIRSNAGNRSSSQSTRQTKRLANALPLTFIFSLVGVLVVYYQFNLANLQSSPMVIEVGVESNESQEEGGTSGGFQPVAPIERSPEIISIADRMESQYVSESIDAQQALTAIQIKTAYHLEKTQSVLVLMIESLMIRKDYAKALALLELINEADRIKLNQDFYYAKCLSKEREKSTAITAYQNILARDPNHQPATINLGLLLQSEDRLAEAKALYLEAIEYTAGSRKAKVFAGLGDVELKQGFPIAAIDYYQRSIEYRPTSALTWRKLVRAKVAAKRPAAEIITSFERASSLAPNNGRLFNDYADYLFQQMQFKQAVNILRKSVSLSREAFEQRLHLLATYLELRRPINAKKQIGYFRKYMLFDHHSEWAQAAEQYMAKNYRESIDTLRATLKKGRNNNFAYFLLGRAYRQLGLPKNAAVYLEKVSEDDSFFNLAQFHLAQVYTEAKESQKAMPVLKALLARIPDNHSIAYEVADLAYDQRNFPVAWSTIDLAIAAAPQEKKYRLLKSRIAWRTDRQAESIQLLQDLLAQNPRYKRALYRLADYQEKYEQPKEALETFNKLLEVSREYSDTLYRVARLQVANNQPELVTRLLQEYLEGKNNDIRARLLYAINFCDASLINDCDKQLELVLKLAPDNEEALELRQKYFPQQATQSQEEIAGAEI
ncbi:tetratricopeptide repeat protein [Aliikangiella marina]|nr:tetratricopeptide repeat protein [Aliikangiella marina]